jgi:hypothetical protein
MASRVDSCGTFEIQKNDAAHYGRRERMLQGGNTGRRSARIPAFLFFIERCLEGDGLKHFVCLPPPC